jgi:hypothetical protein
MADIQEIPLDIPEDIPNNTEIMQDNTEDNRQVVEDIAEVLAAEEVKPIKPKAKGRPKGAPNKGPSKPRVKKTQIQEDPVEETMYEPSSPRRNLKIPTDPTSSDVAAAMLKLLQDQSYSRQSRKQRLYSSWFQ